MKRRHLPTRTFVTLICATILSGVFVIQTNQQAAAAERANARLLSVYVGTYTGGESEGIYLLQLNLDSGELSEPVLAAKSENPSFLAIHPTRKLLYAVNEVGKFRGRDSGGVSAFSIDPRTGKLTLLNQQPSGGGAPCHLVVDNAGKNVLVANYSGGSVISLPIQEDGSLGEATSFIQHKGSSVTPRQKGPHAHSINLDAANRFAFAADLGLDKVLIYKFNAKQGKLAPNDPASASIEPGSGPRHFDFHPNGKFAYVINEMNLTVTAFSYNADRGSLTTLQTISTVPDDADRKGLSTAEVRVHPSGKFLYGSNRGHNTIVVYRINQDTGKLTHVENEPTGGKTPRNFFIEPTGKFLLAENQSTNSIVVFRINQDTGELKDTGHKIEVPSPVCIRTVAQTR